jgi:enamine deaminase RidA (YjgF/YER057c/UK114 family)
VDAEGKVVGSTYLDQARQAFRNLSAALDAVGAALADVAKFNVYMVDYSWEALEGLMTAGKSGARRSVPAHSERSRRRRRAVAARAARRNRRPRRRLGVAACLLAGLGLEAQIRLWVPGAPLGRVPYSGASGPCAPQPAWHPCRDRADW